MKLNETFDKVLPYREVPSEEPADNAYEITIPNNDLRMEVEIMGIGNNAVAINFFSFGRDKAKKDKGQITYNIFSTIIQIIQDYVEEYNIEEIDATAMSDKKADIYEKLLNRFANGWDVYRMSTTVLALKNN